MAPQYAMDLLDQRAGDIDEVLIARRQRQTEVGRHRKGIGPEVALPIARPLGKARHQLDRIQQAIELMTRFAERTGDGKRYLWTDAFAVTTYLGLALATRDQHFID